MAQIIREGNKVYHMNDKGIVVEASAQTEKTAAPVETPAPIKIGSRVEAEGKRGTLHARTSSVYGDTLAVRFDDGTLGEYVASDVTPPQEHEDDTTYASKLDEIKAHFLSYQELPHYTVDEMDEKEKVAKKLRHEATQAIRQSGVPYQDRVVLDNIIMATGNDLSDLAEAKHEASLRDNTQYQRVASARYSMSDVTSYGGPLMGAAGNEDASWLETAMDGMTVTETTDADLAATATSMVAALDHDLLSNDDVLRDAVAFQEGYLGIENNDEMKNKFASYVEEARKEKLSKPATKEAAVEEDDLSNFDTSSLFM